MTTTEWRAYSERTELMWRAWAREEFTRGQVLELGRMKAQRSARATV